MYVCEWIMCLIVISVTIQKKWFFFHFDLKWNMTLQCSLQVNEIYLQYGQTKHFWTNVLFLPWYLLLNAPRPIMHITTCMQQDHLLSFRGPSLVSSGDAVTLWMRSALSSVWLCSSVEALIWWHSGTVVNRYAASRILKCFRSEAEALVL